MFSPFPFFMKNFLNICLASFAFASISHAAPFKTVVIDAGHGGHDNGAVNGKVYEKHLALDTAYRLQALLKKAGYNTVMTRSQDYFVPLGERTRIANAQRDAIFVSIHFNHTWRQNACGLETYYFNGEGQQMAPLVQDGIVRHTSTLNRQAKFARFFVIRNTTMPGILVEGGFVSNNQEKERMKSAGFRQGIAEGIAEGLKRYAKLPAASGL